MNPNHEIDRGSHMAFSIRGLLIAVAFVAVACAAFKYAGTISWSILAAVTLVLVMGAAVLVIAGTASQRVRAGSFLACFAVYGGSVLLAGMYSVERSLPTSLVVESLAPLVQFRLYYDMETGEPIKGNVIAPGDVVAGEEDPALAALGQYTRRLAWNFSPTTSALYRVSHLICAILFGFLGSWLAGLVYRRYRIAAQ